MNNTTRRYPRSLADAYPCERYPATQGPYRRMTFARQLARVAGWLAAFAFVGALIGVSF